MTLTDQHTLLQAHYATLQAFWENVRERTGHSAIVLSAGSQQFHFHDDQGPAFRPNPLMVQWIAKQHIGENARLPIRQEHPQRCSFINPMIFGMHLPKRLCISRNTWKFRYFRV